MSARRSTAGRARTGSPASTALAALAVVAPLAWLALPGCGDDQPAREPVEQPPPEAVTRVTEQGPVKVTVQAWPARPTLGDPIHLHLTVEARPGVTATAPFEDVALGAFDVAGWKRDTRRGADGTAIEVQRYTLQAKHSGKHRIPPLRLEMIDGRAAVAAPAAGSGSGGLTPVEILTDEIPIEVAPIDPERAHQRLSDPLPAMATMVGGTSPWLIAGLIVLAAAVVVGVGFGVRAVRRGAELRARVSAYEHAVARLVALEQRGAPDEAGADAWFVELSGIVRAYLEGRYQVRAPELTTEEFLQVARRHGGLRGEHRELLSAFLERCDRVKFAGYRPDPDESIATLRAARAFVEDTRVRAQEVA